jgi:hypothetical protein
LVLRCNPSGFQVCNVDILSKSSPEHPNICARAFVQVSLFLLRLGQLPDDEKPNPSPKFWLHLIKFMAGKQRSPGNSLLRNGNRKPAYDVLDDICDPFEMVIDGNYGSANHSSSSSQNPRGIDVLDCKNRTGLAVASDSSFRRIIWHSPERITPSTSKNRSRKERHAIIMPGFRFLHSYCHSVNGGRWSLSRRAPN